MGLAVREMICRLGPASGAMVEAKKDKCSMLKGEGRGEATNSTPSVRESEGGAAGAQTGRILSVIDRKSVV